MKNFKRCTANLLTVSVLSLTMLFGLTACGSSGDNPDGSSPAASGDEIVNQNADSGNEAAESVNWEAEQEAEQTAALTLADGEAFLIYAKDTYAVAAFHGPDGDISGHFCNSAGEQVGGFVGYGHPSDGWTLIISEEFPEGYDYSGIGVSITDYQAEKNADGTHVSQDYLNIPQMSTEQMAEIGLDFLDGHCCLISSGRGTYNATSFGIMYAITWFDDYFFTPLKDMEGFTDRFTYYAGDGTPLEQYFEGYSTLEITPMINMVDVMLVRDEGSPNDKAKNESMCDELEACEPYMIYTGLDGTQQRFDLMTED